MTTSWLRSHWWNFQRFRAAIDSHHMLPKCRWSWQGCLIFCLWLNYSRWLQFGCPVLHISLTEEFGRVSLALSRQFVKIYRLLASRLNSILYICGHCAHHPAGLAIFALSTQLMMIFVIILVLPILSIAGACKLAQAISNSVQHLIEWCFRLCGCHSRLFSISHIFLFLLISCLSILD